MRKMIVAVFAPLALLAGLLTTASPASAGGEWYCVSNAEFADVVVGELETGQGGWTKNRTEDHFLATGTESEPWRDDDVKNMVYNHCSQSPGAWRFTLVNYRWWNDAWRVNKKWRA
jgi:hypothetical protein